MSGAHVARAWAGLGICARAALRNALRACLTGRGRPLLRRIMSDNAIESVPAGVFDEIAGLQSMCECVRVCVFFVAGDKEKYQEACLAKYSENKKMRGKKLPGSRWALPGLGLTLPGP